jgi:general secretion pathway protein D
MVRALQSDSRTNILGTPSVVTRDNQEAKMEVAQEVPFLTGQYSTTNGTGSAFQTIQREDIGTILTVTPTINEGETVLLKLQVESSSLAASSAGAVDLITNKNSISTSVLVERRWHAGAGRIDPGQRHQQRVLGAPAGQHSDHWRAVSHPQYREDQDQLF